MIFKTIKTTTIENNNQVNQDKENGHKFYRYNTIDINTYKFQQRRTSLIFRDIYTWLVYINFIQLCISMTATFYKDECNYGKLNYYSIII